MNRNDLLKDMDNKKGLFGLFFAFSNRLQTAGDAFYDEITCKQFFLLICLSLFQGEAPTINELSEVMGSSHQNVKQLVNKLEKLGLVMTYSDEKDKRKLRVAPREKLAQLSEKYEEKGIKFMDMLYHGISPEEIEITFKTMLKIENNIISMEGEK